MSRRQGERDVVKDGNDTDTVTVIIASVYIINTRVPCPPESVEGAICLFVRACGSFSCHCANYLMNCRGRYMTRLTVCKLSGSSEFGELA